MLVALALLLSAAPSGAADDGDDTTESAEEEPYEWANVVDGMEFASAALFYVDPETGRVAVTIDIDVKNVKPSVTRGWTRTQYYFDSLYLLVPKEAVDVAATSNGVGLAAAPLDDEEPDEDNRFDLIEVKLPRNLFYGQSRSVQLTYNLVSGGPRADADVVINPAHLSFSATAYGDAGATDVTVSLPEGFEVQVFGVPGVPETVDGREIYRYEAIERPLDFFIFVSGENPDGLAVTDLDVDGLDVMVAAWPGDSEWQALMEELVPEGLEQLETMIGIERPEIEALEVRESYAPYLYGYAGWYIADDGLIEVGDELDEHILFHELGHIWFNNELFTERWITEGLANDFAARLIEELGLESEHEIQPVPRYDLGAVQLNAWVSPQVLDDEAAAREEWAYNASWWIIHGIREEIGDEAMAEVLASVAGDLEAYRDGPPLEVEERRNWQRFLDLVEEVGGSEKVASTFERYVLTPSQSDRVARRAESRSIYAELEARTDGWGMPQSLRNAMDRWRFEFADDLIEIANGVLDHRADVEARAAELDLVVHPELEQLYRTLDDETAEPAAAIAADQLAAMSTVEEARERLVEGRSTLQQIGLWWTDPPTELADVEAAFAANDLSALAVEAEELSALLDDARRVGVTRVQKAAGGVALFMALLTTLIIWRVRRRRRRARLAATVDAVAATYDVSAPDAAGSDSVDDEVLEHGLGDTRSVLHGAEVGEPGHGAEGAGAERISDGSGDERW